MTDTPTKRILLGLSMKPIKNNTPLNNLMVYTKRKNINNLTLFQSDGQGTIEGEGAAFFTLGSEKTPNAYAKLLGVKTIYRPEDAGITSTNPHARRKTISIPMLLMLL